MVDYGFFGSDGLRIAYIVGCDNRVEDGSRWARPFQLWGSLHFFYVNKFFMVVIVY